MEVGSLEICLMVADQAGLAYLTPKGQCKPKWLFAGLGKLL
jgi:hypothetical protein